LPSFDAGVLVKKPESAEAAIEAMEEKKSE
jgi:hypothetical protein